MIDPGSVVPSTEGLKYAGSKLKLLPHILGLIRRVEAHTVLDACSGTTRVAQALARCGYRVIANDIAAWSEVLGTCYLLNRKPAVDYEDLVSHLNAVKPVDGWFSQHYGGRPRGGTSRQADGRKRPWQLHATRKLDGVRAEIDRLDLAPVDRAVALTSLMLALDRVDSTIGHHAAYLREWSARSYRPLVLRVPALVPTRPDHAVVRGSVFDLPRRARADLAYLDPPYGSNNEKMPPSRVRYAAYYHLWTTVCLNDQPRLFGQARRRMDTADPVAASEFENFRRDARGRSLAVAAIDRAIRCIDARWILLSYSSGGRATAAELHEVLGNAGKILEAVAVDYRRNVMARMTWTRAWLRAADEPHREFLFLVEKQ